MVIENEVTFELAVMLYWETYKEMNEKFPTLGLGWNGVGVAEKNELGVVLSKAGMLFKNNLERRL